MYTLEVLYYKESTKRYFATVQCLEAPEFENLYIIPTRPSRFEKGGCCAATYNAFHETPSRRFLWQTRWDIKALLRTIQGAINQKRSVVIQQEIISF